MFTVEYIGVPTAQADLDGIFALLCECDNDFVPPLSARTSSSQKELSSDTPIEAKPHAYFAVMRQQHFVVVRTTTPEQSVPGSGQMVAFLTFKPDYTCRELAEYGTSTYMTTGCVSRTCRGHGLANRMYEMIEHHLPEHMRHDFVTTRTWSTNGAQVHSFEKRGYKRVTVLADDRGSGVDTIYYAKRVRP